MGFLFRAISPCLATVVHSRLGSVGIEFVEACEQLITLLRYLAGQHVNLSRMGDDALSATGSTVSKRARQVLLLGIGFVVLLLLAMFVILGRQGEVPIAPQPVPDVAGVAVETSENAAGAGPGDLPHSGVVKRDGVWRVNLITLRNKASAEQLYSEWKAIGIPVLREPALVSGVLLWRLRLAGFDTEAEAVQAASEVKERLHLEEVWVNRHQAPDG
ncbi:MAG: SPOR domain-containing protein [Candidatus Sedimenticola endophacoides]